MHHSTDSLDSAVNIRTNPLNIHMQDGTDLVVGNPSPSQFVSRSKPTVVRPASPTAQTAEQLYAHEAANLSRHSILEPVMPLKLNKKKSLAENMTWDDFSSIDLKDQEQVVGQKLQGKQLVPQEEVPVLTAENPSEHATITELSIPEFSPLLSLDFEKFSLKRQGTIKSQQPVEIGPSKSTELMERIRSIRTHKPDPAADEPLPTNLLRVIQFSPNAEWPETLETDSVCASAAASPALSQITTVSSYSEKNIDIASDSYEDSCPTVELPEIAETAEFCEIGEPGPVEEKDVQTGEPAFADLGSTRAASPSSPPNISVSSPIDQQQAQVEPQTPDITVTDPISENDRGRLFMQIRKLQSLRGIPIDSSRNPRFTITLDNGIQTVTTPAVPLPCAKFSGTIHANIGQEFELTVGRDLELVMTLNILMDALQPPPKPRALGARSKASSPQTKMASPPATPKQQSRVKSFFSPKRKSKQVQQQVQQQIEVQDDYIQTEKEHDALMAEYRKRRDIWKGLTGKEGEFGRGYLFESHYERDIYGKAETYSLPLYNEWQGQDTLHVGDLELTLMFIPRLYGSEKLPGSVVAAQEQLKAAQIERQFNCAGYLTQNGGDCKVNRRRYFTLNGSEFIAHHEASHKVRAVIHMENALDVVDSENVTPNDNMWCIYEDRSFLLVFSDGEEVSFYADTPRQKNEWVSALAKSMNYCSGKMRSWEDLVLDYQPVSS